jgi:hypothetical protein
VDGLVAFALGTALMVASGTAAAHPGHGTTPATSVLHLVTDHGLTMAAVLLGSLAVAWLGARTKRVE